MAAISLKKKEETFSSVRLPAKCSGVITQIMHTSKHRTRPANLCTYSVNEEQNKAKSIHSCNCKPWPESFPFSGPKNKGPTTRSQAFLCTWCQQTLTACVFWPQFSGLSLALLINWGYWNFCWEDLKRPHSQQQPGTLHSVTTDCHQGTPRQPGKIREGPQQEDIAFQVYCLLGPEMRGLWETAL